MGIEGDHDGLNILDSIPKLGCIFVALNALLYFKKHGLYLRLGVLFTALGLFYVIKF